MAFALISSQAIIDIEEVRNIIIVSSDRRQAGGRTLTFQILHSGNGCP
jgi:hypothetical protein